MSVNQTLLETSLEHAILSEQIKAAEVVKVVNFYERKVIPDLRAKLASLPEGYTRRQAMRQLKEAEQFIGARISELSGQVQKDMLKVGQYDRRSRGGRRSRAASALWRV